MTPDVMERKPFEAGEEHRPLSTADLAGTARAETHTVKAEAPADETPLFAGDEVEGFRARWQSIQGTFVDEPRQSVEQADERVASVIKRLAEVFADERARLEREWDKGDEASTEDLRIALRRYRTFFGRLLSI